MTKNKLVFQEVGSEVRQNLLEKSKAENYNSINGVKHIRTWLLCLALMIFVMVIVGGITRLTDSGLSIVEWNLVAGIIPPLNTTDWIVEFDKYKEIPEFALINSDMTLQDFKIIFYWEWGHRLWGRLIGLVWFFGFVFLILRKMIPAGWNAKLLLIGALIGVQGTVGWFMVQSGLVNEMTDVASYWLAFHLGIAFLLIGLVQWCFLALSRSSSALIRSRRTRDKRLGFWTNIFMLILYLQILLGALVAGIDAGTAYTDWPFMAGKVFPIEYLQYEKSPIELLENSAFVQFNHRITAYLLTVVGLLVWLKSRKSPILYLKKIYSRMLLLVFFQVCLGIFTILNEAELWVALAHQFIGLVLWSFVIWVRFENTYPRRQLLS